MRIRKRAAPLLLLLLPAIASAASLQAAKGDTTKDVLDPLKPADLETQDYLATTSSIGPVETNIGVKARAGTGAGAGTKDAPVDGRDGKPHEGPFVEDTKADSATKSSKDTSTSDKTTSKVDVKGSLSDTGVKLEGDKNVMSDKDRLTPKEGTTGTEGGVSERTRLGDTGVGKQEKKPDSPKSQPLIPEDGDSKSSKSSSRDKSKETVTGKDSITGEVVEKPKGAQGLEKPTDLPEKPHDIPHPSPNGASLPKDSTIDSYKDDKSSSFSTPHSDTTYGTSTTSKQSEEAGIIRPFHSLVLSLTMILVSEVGDKTFLIAALMAMRHPRVVVFSAAFSALITMTILSAILGHTLPALIPQKYTHLAAAVLFLAFGAKMLREGLHMDAAEGVGEEMKEVEMELEEKELEARKLGGSRKNSTVSAYVLEAGRGRRSRSQTRLPAPRSPSSSRERSPERSGAGGAIQGLASGMVNLCSLILSPAWVQTFIMTFLGEWGDRSQIATIAMAAGQDYWWVTAGAIAGHAVCTGVAVIGGRAIAGRVSMRVVTLGGAIAFLMFGLIYGVEALYSG